MLYAVQGVCRYVFKKNDTAACRHNAVQTGQNTIALRSGFQGTATAFCDIPDDRKQFGMKFRVLFRFYTELFLLTNDLVNQCVGGIIFRRQLQQIQIKNNSVNFAVAFPESTVNLPRVDEKMSPGITL